MQLVFEPTEDTGKSFEVSTGRQRLARVQYDQIGDTIMVVKLDVEPYLEGFDIASRILDALLATDGVNQIQIVSSLFMASYYEEAGFDCAEKQILMTKIKS